MTEDDIEELNTRRERNFVADLNLMMQDQAGRSILHFILSRLCHVGADTFHSDPYHAARLSGERHVGLLLTAYLMDANAANYLTMIKENGPL